MQFLPDTSSQQLLSQPPASCTCAALWQRLPNPPPARKPKITITIIKNPKSRGGSGCLPPGVCCPALQLQPAAAALPERALLLGGGAARRLCAPPGPGPGPGPLYGAAAGSAPPPGGRRPALRAPGPARPGSFPAPAAGAVRELLVSHGRLPLLGNAGAG